MQTEPRTLQPELPGYVVRHANAGAQRGWLATVETSGERCVIRFVTPTGHTIADVDAELPHCIPVRDIRRTELGGDLAIVEDFVEGHALSEVLRVASLTPGQIVTLLVPLLETIAALECQLWVPAALEPTDVIVDVSGRCRIANDVALVANSNSAEYLGRLAAITALLARLPPSLVRPELEADALATHLMLSCEPEPIDVSAGVELQRALPIRLNPIEFDPAPDSAALGKPIDQGVLTVVRSLAGSVRSRCLEAIKARRFGKIGFATALAAALVAIALVAIPSPQADSVEGSAPIDRTDAEPTAPQTPVSTTSAVAFGDAASAAVALIAVRSSCASAHEPIECLEQADEKDASQYREDDERMKTAQTLRFSQVTNASSELVSTMGEAALVRVQAENATASVLLVQTEAGWRIRELFD